MIDHKATVKVDGFKSALTQMVDRGTSPERIAQLAGLKVEIFKPSLDRRYSETKIVSHDSRWISSTPVDNAYGILLLAAGVDVVGIDEAQFFDDSIVDVCNQLANNGIRTVVAGLDMNFMAKPFGPMPALLAVAEYITKVHAICMRCGSLANYSYRKSSEDQIVVVGEKEKYEPLCRACYNRTAGSTALKDHI